MTGTMTQSGIDPWLFFDGVKTLRDGLSDAFFREGHLDSFYRRQQIPLVNVWASDDAVTVDVDLPGVDTDKVDISVERKLLTLRGETLPSQVGDDTQVYRKERFEGQFERTIELPFEVDTAHAKASARHGVLRIALPKSEEARVRKIPVTVSA